MKVRILHFSGVDDRGQRLSAGGEFDVPEALALDLIARGHAELVRKEPAIEAAVFAPAENTARRAYKAKPRREVMNG